jgi:hypothetical protein
MPLAEVLVPYPGISGRLATGDAGARRAELLLFADAFCAIEFFVAGFFAEDFFF